MIIILNGLTPVTFKQIDQEAEKQAHGGIEWENDESSEPDDPVATNMLANLWLTDSEREE